MPRAFLIVMDSVGIGAAPDAGRYGDSGADTVGHIADFCARERGAQLEVPHLVRLGLGRACYLATGRVPAGLDGALSPGGRYGCAAEVSKGKDTPSGHWEIAGLPVPFEWGYFPKTSPCFPPELVAELCGRAALPGILGDCHASGTEIIERLGAAHMSSGKPICYTSADSVFQIAAHEEAFGLERLYDICAVARELTRPLMVGRVIARPFIGEPGRFERTPRRRDFAIAPPAPTLLSLASREGRQVISIGKIGDIFAHEGTGREVKATGNSALMEATAKAVAELADGGLAFTNLIDFDSLYGHRRDPPGYARALEAFDAQLGQLLGQLQSGDALIVTADHGCDPTWAGTDHTREWVPVLAVSPGTSGASMGRRTSFADVGAACAAHLRLPEVLSGQPAGMLD
ncbi:phosphopentomutase [Chelatococcus reniformis]|uniref:Phosphopentomutase n=1 Tax=Chelatococcus reniformis TaxID=1494448 RepID=A0A916XKG6_9HYPH|nr:phosphopentomutase [Chelatococcus reniformis]GGC78430.1 phosphopentomutase [Chelatococcus reniformis]